MLSEHLQENPSAIRKWDPQLTGNVGLYHCCYRLSLLGWNAMPTARNARGVDIIAYNQDASRFIGVQVKSLSRRNPVLWARHWTRSWATPGSS